MPNRLAQEKSPYLLQHAHNPVDWYAWGDEAFDRARREDKPVLVSIGYSACHWCHVMAHESFEDVETARLMNERFVNVKVDREERPDVDAIYMEAVQALNGQGGWPLNVFLLPDGRPYFGGTYFPKDPRYGMPSWRQVLEGVADVYRERRTDALHNAEALVQYVRQAQQAGRSSHDLSPEILEAAWTNATSQIDWTEGGFGGAPKFPQPLALEYALRMSRRYEAEEALRFVDLTLRRMAAGGIYDQLGGGFHRYSVDAHWLVPHFEKMLYDNALLALLYLHLYQATHAPLFRRVASETLDYLLRDLQSPAGGLYSAQDADSDGVEGKYYVWTPEEVRSVLDPPDAELALRYFGVRPEGNFEGQSILTAASSAEEIARATATNVRSVEAGVARTRHRLLEARSRRIPPGKDTKILTSWNALGIEALALGGRVLGRSDYLKAARRCADFVLRELRPDGTLVRSYKDGPSSIPGFLEDHAFLAGALLTLYEAIFDPKYFYQARETVEKMVDLFWDPQQNAFFDTGSGSADLIVRPRSVFDNPIASGNSAACLVLLRLHAHTGEDRYVERALQVLRSVSGLLPRAPLALPHMLSALDFYLSTPVQIAISAERLPEAQALADAVYDRYLPNAVVAVGNAGTVPLLEGRIARDAKPTAYVCRHFTCDLPVMDVEGLVRQLDDVS